MLGPTRDVINSIFVYQYTLDLLQVTIKRRAEISTAQLVLPEFDNNKHLLDEIESNIRFVLPGQVMLGEAKLSLTSLD